MSEVSVFAGQIKPKKVYNIAIVVSSFNSLITDSLLKGALDTLTQRGIANEHIEVYRVPGAFEIPLTCKRIFSSKNIDGIITLGAIIRGETPHFEFVAGECASGIQRISLEFNKPVSFGVLTTENVEQALNRAGIKFGNKGCDAANALIQQLQVYEEAFI
ncbi:MAG: 6,7-dimethyl-8-ribityllumazine synthase [Spirochaetia bacterium]|nr:6,7-dimethyl-8-ribityllumazine synthase [Spirochaetia bacterium]